MGKELGGGKGISGGEAFAPVLECWVELTLDSFSLAIRQGKISGSRTRDARFSGKIYFSAEAALLATARIVDNASLT